MSKYTFPHLISVIVVAEGPRRRRHYFTWGFVGATSSGVSSGLTLDVLRYIASITRTNMR
jgi:hypothetical protein